MVNAVAGGWTMGGKLYLYSGAPFSVTDSKIPGTVNSSGVLTPLADVIVPSAVGSSCGKAAVNTPCVTTSDFATYYTAANAKAGIPYQTDWGNVAPNSFRGPGYFDIDAQVSRNFQIKEKVSLTLGIQAYNALNHANFALPTGSATANTVSVSSGSLGLITSTLGPPTSIYGTGQGASVSGRLAVLTGRLTF